MHQREIERHFICTSSERLIKRNSEYNKRTQIAFISGAVGLNLITNHQWNVALPSGETSITFHNKWELTKTMATTTNTATQKAI